MTKTYRQGAIGAVLDEYERAILDLSKTISSFSDTALTATINDVSIQSILSHVVRSGYAYALYIQKLLGEQNNIPDLVYRKTVSEYQNDLTAFFIFTENVLKNFSDNQLEECDDEKKITTSWGQVYDIEQMMEHAIVHILRHRRQIEKFKIELETK
ncbi:DinB family protein [Flavobacterium sharifuzzamanii]|uniref:DinB family protein n=1 Tax=Flavobacterium sharifuzzamanii TaxID=2211133 RepID=UPI000DAEB5A9|nr:DinB family protein [Flavobacterium sharifuzzamanii]KAF2081989.1 DinB family protein [Flavobacterium sharifuzzamanii]